VITHQQYKKRTKVGDIQVPAGALHQIVNSGQFSGWGGRIFEQFVEEIVKPGGGDLYLSVRKENTVACQFYERHGIGGEGAVVCGDKPRSGLPSFTETVSRMGPEDRTMGCGRHLTE
jgi:hypothetical protein